MYVVLVRTVGNSASASRPGPGGSDTTPPVFAGLQGGDDLHPGALPPRADDPLPPHLEGRS